MKKVGICEDWNMKPQWAKRAMNIGAIGILAIAVFGLALMNLWNWLVLELF